MQTPIDWQAEARRMRAQGKTSAEIAMALGQAPSTVRTALLGTPRSSPPETLGAGAQYTAPHVPRTPRPILNQDMVRSAAADFAAGRISRDELMKQISPGHRPLPRCYLT